MKEEITVLICEDVALAKELFGKFGEKNQITYINIMPAEKRDAITEAIEALEN